MHHNKKILLSFTKVYGEKDAKSEIQCDCKEPDAIATVLFATTRQLLLIDNCSNLNRRWRWLLIVKCWRKLLLLHTLICHGWNMVIL